MVYKDDNNPSFLLAYGVLTNLILANWPFITAALLIAGFGAITALLLQAAWSRTEQAQRDDRHSRALLSALEQGAAWTVFLDEHGRIMQANPAFQTAFQINQYDKTTSLRALLTQNDLDPVTSIQLEAAQQARLPIHVSIQHGAENWLLIGQPWLTSLNANGYWLLGIEMTEPRRIMQAAHRSQPLTSATMNNFNPATIAQQTKAAALRHAIYFSSEDLPSIYRPIYDLVDVTVAGFTIDVRWADQPHIYKFSELLAIAATAECDTALWMKAFADGCRQLAIWQAARPALFISIPLSRLLLNSASILQAMAAVLKFTGIFANQIKLELPNTFLDAQQQARVLQLRAQGFRLAMPVTGDDLTGFAIADQLQVTDLMLDHSFVERLHSHGAQRDLAGILGKLSAPARRQLTAAGIDGDADLELLRDIGCTLGIGPLLDRTAKDSLMPDQEAPARVVRLKTA